MVENYFGEESFKFDEVSLTHGYDEINFIDLDRRNPSIKPWQKDFLGLDELYESSYKSKVSSQSCFVHRPLAVIKNLDIDDV